MNLYEMLKPQEKAFHNALQSVVNQFGPYDQEGSGVWVGYVSAQNNTDSSIGVKCLNCSFYQGEGKCSLLSYLVEEEAICRLAAIPDELVNKNMGKSVSHWNDYGKNDAVDFHTETAKKGMDLMNDDCLSKAGPCWEGYVMRGMKPGKNGKPVPNCVPATTKAYQGCGCPECLAEDITCEQCDLCNPSVAKADNSYTPNAGMKSAARRALKWKEDGLSLIHI
ncbi:MAG: hypothetical protein EB127_31350 [Alphaproteobacteria bacterium]|nr:hypothetical protein [Alphaproteobacteria bacterium]